MATPTITRTISSEEHRITVTSTGGAGNISTIAQVYAKVIAAQPTAMSYDSGTNTYTLHRLTAGFSAFRIGANSTVQIPQDTTFINQGTNTAGASNTVFQISEGGKLILKPGSRIKFSSSGGYVYLYGTVGAVGTEDNPIIWQSYRQGYCYSRTAGGQTRFQWVIFKNITYSTGYYFHFSQYDQYRAIPIIFKNVKFTHDSSSKYGYPFYFSAGGMYSNVQIDGFQCDYTNAILIYGCSVKLKNGIMKNCAGTNIVVYGGGNVISVGYQTSKDDTTFPTGRFQSMVVLQNIQFDNLAGAGSYAIYARYNSLVYVKNCKFSATNGIIYCAFYSAYGSVIIQNNNDITALLSNSNRKQWAQNGTILHGHQLDLTVLDNNSNALQNASVTIYQADYKQNWNFLTDINGKVKNIFGDNIILINKEESSLNTFDIWCDTADTSSYHYIVTSYPGYVTNITRIDTNIDNNITIRLTPIKIPIQPGDERMQYLIVEQLKTALQTIDQISFIGYYPYDYAYIINRLPCVLIKFGNTNVSSPDGLHTYDVVASTQFILYSNLGIEQSLDIEQSIITKIIETLHNNSTYCINGIADTAVQAGEINEYISPDTTGYNANILVRKIIQSYSFQKII